MGNTTHRTTLAGGLILVLIGSLFLVENWFPELSLWEILLRYWPIIFLWVGFRSLYRYFVLSTRPGSLLGGLLFIFIGMALIAHNLGRPIHFWYLAARYWPVLLILIGIEKIIDHYRFAGKVSIGFRSIFAIFLIILFGLLAAKIEGVDWDVFAWRLPEIVIGGRNIPIRERVKDSYAYHEEASINCSSGSRIRIENFNGHVSVSPNPIEEIRVKLKKVVYEGVDQNAKEISDKIKLIARKEDGTYVIRTNRDQLEQKNYNYETHLEVLVPQKSNLNINNRHGDVIAEGLLGDQQIISSYGRVELTNINGKLKVSNKEDSTTLTGIHGDIEISCRNSKVGATNIVGNLILENSYSSSDIYNVDGEVRIKDKEGLIRLEKIKKNAYIDAPGSKIEVLGLQGGINISSPYNKPILLENVGSSVNITGSNGSITARNIKGHVKIEANYGDVKVSALEQGLQIKAESTSVQAKQIKGPIDISTSRKDVAINSFEDQLTIRNEHGSVSIETDKRPKGNFDIKNQYGKIEIILPETSGFTINALSKSGAVESEFTSPQMVVSNEVDGQINGSYGRGGPHLMLTTSYSEIALRKTSKMAAKNHSE